MAELRLGVSFDLVYFRRELQKLGRIAASEFTAPIKIKLDRRVVTQELNSLRRAIGERKYNVELNIVGNLSKKTFDELQERLDTLSKRQKIEIPLSVTNGVTKKDIDDTLAVIRGRIKQNETLSGGKLLVGVSIKSDITNEDVQKVKTEAKKKLDKLAALQIESKIKAPGVTNLLTALQKNLNRQDPLSVKARIRPASPAILQADVTAFKKEVEEKLSGIVVKVKAELGGASASTSEGSAATPSRTFLQELKALDKETLQDVYKAAAKDALLAFDEGIINNRDKIARALNDAAADASDGFIAALQDKKSALFQAAGQYANALLGGLKKTLKIQSPSKEMFDIGDDAGKGFELGLLKAMELAEKSATSQMRRMLDRLARMALMMTGMSPEQISRQVTQARALPSLNFPATVPPPQRIPIGPSETGRMLSAGRSAAGLIGAAQPPAGLLPSATMQGVFTSGLEAIIQSLVSQARGMGPATSGAIVSVETGFIPAMRERFARAAKNYLFGIETQVVDLFDAVLRQVESAVDLHIARIEGQISQRLRNLASVTDLGVRGLPMLPGAAVGRAPLALPPAGGTTPIGQMRFNAVRTSQFAPTFPLALPPAGGTTPRGQMRFNAVGTGAFPMDGMHIPSTQLPPGYFASGKLAAGIRGLGADFNKTKLPLAGAVAELGDEFATATKQVLLYGTAYKALAFFTNLPMQALDAATAMQTFRNQLEAVTGSAANADRSFAFVDDLASRFNVPLQSIRDGFTKLYASMAPAGFSSAEIEGLFEGISKAAATFGMSADKVDRVNYAFAQMASKGQIMSEELRGQLGDVLPGSLALFARAAQMSIPEFTKAMEDGAFKGEAMAQVLRNVAKIMNSDFAGGATGAANTLQGALNGLGNSVQRMYEAFEPLVGQIATTLFPAVQEAIDEATQAVKAFAAAASGNQGPANMLEGSARSIYDAMVSVREVFFAAGNVLKNLVPTFALFGRVALSVASAMAAVVNNPIGNFLANVAVQAAIAMAAFQLLAKTGIAEAVAWMLKLIFNTKAATTQLWGLVKASTAAKFGLIALGGAVVITAITTLVGALNSVYQKMLDIQVGARNAAQAIAAMSQTEATVKARSIEGQIALLQKFYSQSKQFGGFPVEASAAEVTAMAAAGGTPGQAFTGPLVNEKTGAYGRGTITPTMVPAAIQALQSQLAAARKQAEPVQATPLALEQVDLAAAEGRTKKEKELKDFAEDKVARLRQQLELQKNLIDVQVDLSKSQKELLKAELEYEIGLDIVEAQYQEAIKTLGEYKEGQRGAAQASMQNAAVLARENVALEYRKALLGDLAGVTNEYENKIFDLNNDIKALRASQGELTASEVLEQKIRFKTVGYTKEQLALIEPFLNKLRKEASMIDTLTRSYEFLVQAREKQEALRKLRNEAAQFRAPLGQERLAELMQTPGYTSEQARQQFALEEQNRRLQTFKQGATDLAGSINSSIGDAITNIATDFQNLQQHGLTFIQTLANAFKQLANTIIQEMTRALINKAVSQLLGFMMPAIGGGGAAPDVVAQMNAGAQQYPILARANGGYLLGGFQAFANGGMVTGPTLGLVGEGRFNEAVVPLPNGKSIPVDLGGGAGNNISTNIVVNMNNNQASSQINGNGGQALGRELEGAVRNVILKESRPGGIIYSNR